MKHYKYLVMQISSSGQALFTNKHFSGTRCTELNTNKTFFTPHDFGGGINNG